MYPSGAFSLFSEGSQANGEDCAEEKCSSQAILIVIVQDVLLPNVKIVDV